MDSQPTLNFRLVPAKSVPDTMFPSWIPAQLDVRIVRKLERNAWHTPSTRPSVSWESRRITLSESSPRPIPEPTKWQCGMCWEHATSTFSTGNLSERDGSVMPSPTSILETPSKSTNTLPTTDHSPICPRPIPTTIFASLSTEPPREFVFPLDATSFPMTEPVSLCVMLLLLASP